MASFGLAEFIPPANVPTFTVSAKTTALARKLIARGTVDGTSLRAVEFGVGRGGYDPFDPTKVILVDGEATALIDSVLTGEGIDYYEEPNSTSASCYCLLEKAQANYLLGEVGIWSVIASSPDPTENGTLILSAVAHFPAKAKNSDMQMALRVLQQM